MLLDILKLSAVIFVWIEVTRDDGSVAEPETIIDQ